jgi:hypothetical protein
MNRNQIIGGLIAGVLIVYVSASVVVEKRLYDLRLHVDTAYEVQQELVIQTAKLLSQGAANEAIAAVVPECPSGDALRYDDLLSTLDKGLSRPDLLALQTLFNRCGDVASSRRSGMSLILSQEVAFLTQLSKQKGLLGSEVDEGRLSDWQNLVEKERQISALFSKLVLAQGAIIDSLSDNVAPTAMAVENIRASAQKVREELNVLTGEASVLRSALIR